MIPKMPSIRRLVLNVCVNNICMTRPVLNSLASFSQYRAVTDEPIELERNPFEKEKIQCILCKHSISPDYKNVQLLSQFQSSYTGRVYGRHITGLCKTRHEQIEREIIKAQNAGLMPTYHKTVDFVNDPKLFDPEKAIRTHKF